MRAIIVFSIYSIWSNHVRENDSDWVELVLKMSDLVWRKNYAFLQKSESIRDCGLKICWGRLKISLEIGCFWIFDVVLLSMFSFWNWKKKRNVFRSFAWDFVGRALKSFFVEKDPLFVLLTEYLRRSLLLHLTTHFTKKKIQVYWHQFLSALMTLNHIQDCIINVLSIFAAQ